MYERTVSTKSFVCVVNGGDRKPTIINSADLSGARSTAASAGSVAADWTYLICAFTSPSRNHVESEEANASSAAVNPPFRARTTMPASRVGSLGNS